MSIQSLVGRIVQVQFIAGRNGLAAVSSEFDKIAFLQRNVRFRKTPKVGEEWKCLIKGDSNPRSKWLGAFFIVPLRKLSESVRWTLEDRPDTGVLGVRYLKLSRDVMVGNRLISGQEFFPVDSGDIKSNWPDWVQKRVAKRFEELRVARDSVIRGARAAKLAEAKRLATLKFGVNPADGHPFQWIGDWLTNGVVWFPRERPIGPEWREYPIPSIPQECWQPFLDGLEGKVLVELIPFSRAIVEHNPRKQAALTARQKKLAALVTSSMWSGNENCKRVSVGRNVIFVAAKSTGQTIHIVDNPGKGAIYVFDEYTDARALADGSTTRATAIKGGAKRILHRSGWQAKVAALLQ